jgi:hypothetical protein
VIVLHRQLEVPAELHGEMIVLKFLAAGKRIGFLLLVVAGLLCSACSNVQVSLPGQGKEVIFQEEFVQGHTANWMLEGDGSGSAVIVPEQLLIELNAPNLVQYATLAEPIFDDFILEVDARLVDGSQTSTYGVLFRMQSPQEFYRFEITGDGMYLLERHDATGSRFQFSDDWRDHVAINQGLNAVNILKVVADGPNIAVYVNDTLLEEVADEGYTEGNIALDAGTFDGAGSQVSFDNLFVYDPNR